MYKESLEKYLSDLSSHKPTPGGGSASALVGALSASLVCMVANFTIGKRKFREFESEVKEIFREALEIKEKLLNMVDKDVDAYNSYVKAKKSSSEESTQRAIFQATQIPYEILNLSFRVLELDYILLSKGNPNLLSDVGVSSELSYASCRSAIYNVKVNLPYLEDKEFFIKGINYILPKLEKIYSSIRENLK